MINGLKKVDEFQKGFNNKLKESLSKNLICCDYNTRAVSCSAVFRDIPEDGQITTYGYTQPYTDFCGKANISIYFYTGTSVTNVISEANLIMPHEFFHSIQTRGWTTKNKHRKTLLPNGRYFECPSKPKDGTIENLSKTEIAKFNLEKLLHYLEPIEIDGYLAMFHGFCKNNTHRLSSELIYSEDREHGSGSFTYLKGNISSIEKFMNKLDDKEFEDLWLNTTGLKWKKKKAISFLRKTAEKRKKTWINKAGKILWLMMEKEKNKKQTT